MPDSPPPMPPAGRRSYDPGAAVVPLRDYVDAQIESVHTEMTGKITASHSELASEIAGLRTEMANAQAQATKEHAAVQAQLTALGTSVDKLTAEDLRDQGARRLRRTIWTAAAAIIAAMAGLCAIAAFVIAQS